MTTYSEIVNFSARKGGGHCAFGIANEILIQQIAPPLLNAMLSPPPFLA
jgi:hypothetical protein